MKLRKILSLTVAAIMAASAMSAVASAAWNVPTPHNSDEAFVYAESFEWDGLYYEALAELDYVTDPSFYYQQKKAALQNDLLYKIERWEVKCAIDAIATEWQYKNVANTSAAIAYAKSLNYNMTEFYTIQYWEGVLNDYIAKQAGIPVTSEASAIAKIKAAHPGILQSENEWWSVKDLNASTYVVDIVSNVYGSAQTIYQGFVDKKTGTVSNEWYWN